MRTSAGRVRISVVPEGIPKERKDALERFLGPNVSQSDDWDLQVVDSDVVNTDVLDSLATQPHKLERTVVLSSAYVPHELRQLIHKDIRHIVGKTEGGESAIQLTLRQVALGTPTKLTDYTEGRIDRMWTLISSDEIDYVVEEVFAELERRGINRRIAENVQVATEELLTNAFFNAPKQAVTVSTTNKRRLVQCETAPVFVELSLGKEHFGLSVRDSFGNTTADTIVESLVRGLAKEPQQVDGAGGLGLMMTLQAVNHLVFTISPNRFTEATILSSRQPSLRRLRARAKSFNVFQID